MFLSKEEERIYDGELGPAYQKAIQILVKIGEIYGAEKLVPISSAHIGGVSYKTIGEAGLKFLRIFSNCKVKTFSTLNPAGMDIVDYKKMGIIDEEFARKQKEIVSLYRRIGVKPTLTCTPYLAERPINRPSRGSIIGWAESSAISFANSVLGARTNRLGAPLALASAITGKTPFYGLLKEENRKANLLIELKEIEPDHRNVRILGYIMGKISKNRVPYIRGISGLDEDELKSFGAAAAASGAVALYHIEGITPGWKDAIDDHVEKVEIDQQAIDKAYEELNNTDEAPEILTFGCPHCSKKEILELLRIFKLKRRNSSSEVWICSSRAIVNELKVKIPDGVKLFCDTCMVVSPIENKFRITGTDSGKAACYLKTLCHQSTRFDSPENLI